MSLESLNRMNRVDRATALTTCCHCRNWAEHVADEAPFESTASLLRVAADRWAKASEAEILEAFEGHPQIGDLSALRNKYATTANAEQGQVVEADENILIRLRDLNQHYLDRFGFIFIVCATGKSAEEMLSLLEARVSNTREQELGNGALEQGKIMQLRLAKLVEDSDE